MQIVIDIPEEDYERLKEYKKAPFCSLTSRTYEAIANGVPLPKGHGRLIDADEEIQRFCGKVCGCTLEECGYGFYCPLVRRMISAPTIIEADKEQK